MAGRRRDAIFMDPEIGGRVLACWQKTQPSNPNHHSLNLWMIAWLKRCKASRWRLLNDATPIPQP